MIPPAQARRVLRTTECWFDMPRHPPCAPNDAGQPWFLPQGAPAERHVVGRAGSRTPLFAGIDELSTQARLQSIRSASAIGAAIRDAAGPTRLRLASRAIVASR